MADLGLASLLTLLLMLGIVIAGLVAFVIVKVRVLDQRQDEAEQKAKRIIASAEREAEQTKKERLLEAKDQALEWKAEAEKEIQALRRKMDERERRITQKEDSLERDQRRMDQRLEQLGQREEQYNQRLKELEEKQKALEHLYEEQTRRLESVAGLTAEDAKGVLLESVRKDAQHDAALLAKRIEDEAREKAGIESRKIISQAIQRCAAEHVVESSVSVVDLPSDEMKGRIIGREGRNIRALEQATGVDLIVDDTPEAVILSGFDPLRREIARLSIESLIKDGRIHPARIEEVVSRVESDMEKRLKEEGEQVAFELGIHNFDSEVLHMLGRLKYRTSYGQNVLNHSRDVAYLAGIMARELEADVEVCLRAGLLHDIGKAIDRDMEGTHLQLGVDLLRKHAEREEVVHAVEAHHFDVEFRTVEAVLVQSADAISAARPGARREVLESYVRRLEKLEELARSFSGVAKAFALQAGREIRVVVESSKISDEEAFWLSKDIARRIEKDLEYPGQIKVTLIRETRVVNYAR